MSDTAGHNSESRKHIILEIKSQLDDVNSRMAVLSEERKRLKGRIKSDLGAKVADFNVLCRMADLEADPRDELFDLLREGFSALGIGTQVSFLDALDPLPEPPKRGRPKKAKEEANGAAIAAHVLEDIDANGDPDERIAAP